MRGENNATLWAAYDMYRRTISGGLYETHFAVKEHGTLSEHRLLCSLQDFFVDFDPPTKRFRNRPVRVHGFKELVLPRPIANHQQTEPFEDAVAHLPDEPDDWLDFARALFPCGRFVFNLRRNTSAQAESAFFRTKRIDAPALQRTNDAMARWHERLAAAGQHSYVMALEDLDEVGATRLARWAGFNCTFHALPHANDPEVLGMPSIRTNADTGGQYHDDYASVRLSCA